MAEFFKNKAGHHNNPLQKPGLADIDNAAIDNSAGIQDFKCFIIGSCSSARITVKKRGEKGKLFFAVKDKADPGKNKHQDNYRGDVNANIGDVVDGVADEQAQNQGDNHADYYKDDILSRHLFQPVFPPVQKSPARVDEGRSNKVKEQPEEPSAHSGITPRGKSNHRAADHGDNSRHSIIKQDNTCNNTQKRTQGS